MAQPRCSGGLSAINESSHATNEDEVVQAPLYIKPPDDPELKELYQSYLQKCCEVGQIEFQLSQLESQKRQMEKTLEVTQRAVRSVAHKHAEKHKAFMAKQAPHGVETASVQ